MTASVTSYVLVFLIAALITGHAWTQLRTGRWIAFEPMTAFWGGALVVYVLQPLQFADIITAWRAQGVVDDTLAWTLAGLASVAIAYETGRGVRWGRRLPAMPGRLSPRRLFLSGLVVVGGGLVGYSYLFASAGGAKAWLATGRGGTDYQNVSGYLIQLAELLPLGVTVLLFHVNLHRVSLLRRVLVWSLAGLMLLWFIYLGTRSRTIIFSLTMLAAYYLPRHRTPPPALLAAGFLALLVVTNFQAAFRAKFTNLSIWQDVDVEEAAAVSLPEILGGSPKEGRSAAAPGLEFNCVASVVELVPDVIPYNWGYGHLELLTRPIPRAIWPEKIYPTYQAYTPIFRMAGLSNSVIATAQEELLTGPSFTFIGHWYSVGGPIAVVVAGFLTGFVMRAFRTIYDRNPGSEGDVIVFATLIPIGFNEATGEPLFFLFALPFTLGPILVLLFFARIRGSRLALSVPSRR